jgi:hypothetical protein
MAGYVEKVGKYRFWGRTEKWRTLFRRRCQSLPVVDLVSKRWTDAPSFPPPEGTGSTCTAPECELDRSVARVPHVVQMVEHMLTHIKAISTSHSHQAFASKARWQTPLHPPGTSQSPGERQDQADELLSGVVHSHRYNVPTSPHFNCIVLAYPHPFCLPDLPRTADGACSLLPGQDLMNEF